MQYKNDELGCSFDVPDKPTVRQQLRWYSEVRGEDEQFVRYWRAAQTVVENWVCEALPDIKANIDELTDPAQTKIIMWAASTVLVHMYELDSVPKN